jgi:hypothetical protein
MLKFSMRGLFYSSIFVLQLYLSTPHLLINLELDPLSLSVFPWHATPALCNVTLAYWAIRKIGRKGRVVKPLENTTPGKPFIFFLT